MSPMVRKIVNFFDKLEDKIRIRLSHWPIVYALIGAIGIVLVWKGVWEGFEMIPWLYGWPSAILGTVILLATGLLVSFFIGDGIIISGFKREKKLVEKTESEVREEESEMEKVEAELRHIEREIADIKADQ